MCLGLGSPPQPNGSASFAMRLGLFKVACLQSPFVAPSVTSGITGVLAA
jgi:hypothetical protein